jgi:hemerythrin
MTDKPLKLGNEAMDSMHEEFVQLLDQILLTDKAGFASLFTQLMDHVEQHFEQEKELMEACRFSAKQEHVGEHQRILGELKQMAKRVMRGKHSMARAYVAETLPGWFTLHTSTMDSALVAALSD